ncbi:MAG: hypothetical protein ABSE90_13015 [Verrucomicrobiota bacterium]
MKQTIPTPGIFVASVWLIFVAICFSNEGSSFLVFLIAFFGSIFWMIVWLIRLIMWFFRRRKETTRLLHQPFLYWSFEPAVLILSVVLVFSGAFSSVRFWMSKSALQAYAENVRSGHISPSGRNEKGRHVGFYTVTETELVTNRVVRLITSADYLDDAGFVYAPSNAPPVLGEDYYTHIAGAWWHWHRSW